MKKKLLAILLVLTLIAGWVPTAAVPVSAKVAVKSVKLNKKQYVLKKGKKVTLKATISPAKAKKSKVTWKSSKSKIATVSKKGVVKAKKNGKTTITATAGGKKAKCVVTVGKPVTKVNANNLTLKVSESKNIGATVTPSDASVKKLIYKSSNDSVATVSDTGDVYGVTAGSVDITITAADCGTVKKVVKVTVQKAESTTKPADDKKSEGTKTDDKKPDDSKTEDKLPFAMSVKKASVSLAVGEEIKQAVEFDDEKLENKNVKWETSDCETAAVVSSAGTVHAITPGVCEITATSIADSRVKVSYEVTVVDTNEVEKTVLSEEELLATLEEGEATRIILSSKEETITIPKGEYKNVTLVVDAPNAHLENAATFKQVLIQSIAEDTFVEYAGNEIFVNSKKGHVYVADSGNPNLCILDSADAITVTNEGSIKNLLIATAAKVLVKGDSMAQRVTCDNIYGGTLTTYIPLDIYSTTSYQLVVGPGGEETAVRVSGASAVPQIGGLGTISITIDSTGENSYVIAENDGSLTDLSKTSVTGRIVLEDGKAATATVYLVAYSQSINNDNISVQLNGRRTKETETDEEGRYTFEDVTVGNYILVVEADGYQLTTEDVAIDAKYDENRGYDVGELVLSKANSQPGNIEGLITDAETGDVVGDGFTVYLRKGINNITADPVAITTTDEDGVYTFSTIAPGQYTIQIRDDSDKYVMQYESVSVLSSATITKNFVMSQRMDTQQARFVLSWGSKADEASADLDIHMIAPSPYYSYSYYSSNAASNEYEIRFSSDDGYSYQSVSTMYDSTQYASLDVDDKEYDGPETITVDNVTPGQYKIFVNDFSNRGMGKNLAKSKPQLQVYYGTTLVDTVKMTEQAGGVWFAGCFDGETHKFTVVDEAYDGKPNSTVRAQIGSKLNRLQQFIVTDATAYAATKAKIDVIKNAYLTEKNETKLNQYLEDITTIVADIENVFKISTMKIGGTLQTYNEFLNNHSQWYYGTMKADEAEESFELNLSNVSTQWKLVDKYPDSEEGNYRYFRLTLTNDALGLKTFYNIDYNYEDANIVLHVEDLDNTNSQCEIFTDMIYLGGLNAQMSNHLRVDCVKDATYESVELKTDFENEEEFLEKIPENVYNKDRVSAILHINYKGAIVDKYIIYIPQGATLTGITDENNTYYEAKVDGYYSWYYENDIYRYRIVGENESLGSTFKVQVPADCTYEIVDSIETDYYNEYEKYVVVTNQKNGISRTYGIFYTQDTSDAAILGITDDNNVYTYYYEDSYSSGYNTISIKGLNSTLGNTYQVNVKPGAKVKIEDTSENDSFDETSDAKITVTAKNGRKRIYYVVYNKEDDKTSVIKSIKFDDTGVYQSYIEYSSINVYGKNAKLTGDIHVEVYDGYTVKVNDESDNYVTIYKNGEEVENYYIYYHPTSATTPLKNISSESCKITSFTSSGLAYEENDTVYYTYTVMGESAECPKDFAAVLAPECDAEVTYYTEEEQAYDSRFDAKIVVTDSDGFSSVYKIKYLQDDTDTNVESVKFDGMTQLLGIDDYSTYGGEKYYRISVIGNSATVPEDLDIRFSGDAEVTNCTVLSEEDRYEYGSYSRYVSSGTTSYYVILSASLLLDVTAKNGATRKYLVCYAQDPKDVIVNGISSPTQEYLGTAIQTSQTCGFNKKDDTNEGVGLILVCGKEAELSSDYELSTVGTPEIKKIAASDEEYPYKEKTYSEWVNISNMDDSLYVTGKAVEYLELTSPNGCTYKYVLLYAMDDRDTIPLSMTDSSNENFCATLDNFDDSTMDLEQKDGTYKSVNVIYVHGNNETLGNDYKLELAEGASIVNEVTPSDAEWNLEDKQIYWDWHYGDCDNYGSIYKYVDIAKMITVKAANGATRDIVITYISNSKLNNYGNSYDDDDYYDDSYDE